MGMTMRYQTYIDHLTKNIVVTRSSDHNVCNQI